MTDDSQEVIVLVSWHAARFKGSLSEVAPVTSDGSHGCCRPIDGQQRERLSKEGRSQFRSAHIEGGAAGPGLPSRRGVPWSC